MGIRAVGFRMATSNSVYRLWYTKGQFCSDFHLRLGRGLCTALYTRGKIPKCIFEITDDTSFYSIFFFKLVKKKKKLISSLLPLLKVVQYCVIRTSHYFKICMYTRKKTGEIKLYLG